VDYPHDLPPTLLRPLYTIDLKRKYDALGHSPYRDLHFKLAQKVQERLGRRFKVYISFYNDTPLLPDAAAEAVRDGARRIVVLHPRVTNPPPGVRAADLRETLVLARYGVNLVETAPLWNADPLPRIFVRRALAATESLDRESVGLIVVGLGHPLLRRSLPTDESNTFQRQNQELAFQKRVRQALIRAGFDDDKVVLAWLRWQHPTLEAAYAQLVAEGCRQIFWIGSGLTADSLVTLYDIPERLRLPVAASGIPITPLGPWNDDDLVAETLVERVKAVADERVEATM
jgi:protoheme ferro-lyase